jgi:hypothetical protein
MSETVYVSVEEHDVTTEEIWTNQLYTCRCVLLDVNVDNFRFAYLQHNSFALDSDKKSSKHLQVLLRRLARNLKKNSNKLNSKIDITMLTDLRLFVSGGTEPDTDCERNAFSLVINPTNDIYDYIKSIIRRDNDAVYLFHQLINRAVTIKVATYETSDDDEFAMAEGKLFFKSVSCIFFKKSGEYVHVQIAVFF